MPIIKFSEFVPDQAPLGNPGVVRATNVYPSPSGFQPVPALDTTTSALDSRPRGAITLRDADGNVLQFAGDAAKLYERSDQSWTDRSKTGGYSTGDEHRWEFTPWKNKLLATNYSNSPQEITLGSTAFSDLTTDFRARHIAVVRDFVVMGNTVDPTDDEVPERVRWSAFDDETDWTVSATTGADFQDLKGGGPVRRVVGGEFGVIFMESSVWRMTFTGAPTWFQFDEVLPNIGTVAPGSVVRDGDMIFFLSDRGFYALQSGTQARPIGATKVDEFILEDFDSAYPHRISGAVDVTSKRILWAYPGAGNTDGRPNRIIVYDQALDRWSLIEREVEMVWRAAGIGTTLEGLDSLFTSIDDVDPVLDARQWKGGVAEINAFDTDFTTGAFSGAPMTATIETKELELNSGRRSRLNAFRPLVHASGDATVTARVGTRNRQIDEVTFGPILNLSSSGRFTTRANAMFHRIRLDITGRWSDAIGVQINRHEAKRGQRRG